MPSCVLPCCCYAEPDGSLFYVFRTPAPPPSLVVTHVNLIQNWFEELKAKVPAGGEVGRRQRPDPAGADR